MFEQTFLAGPARTRRAWTVAVSFCGQTALIALAAVTPLIFFDSLPGVRDVMHVPEAPPPPAKRPLAERAVKVVDVKYVPRRGPLTEPFGMPPKAALIVDIPEPPAVESTTEWGVPGGTGDPRTPSVAAQIAKAAVEMAPPAAAAAITPTAVKPAEQAPQRIRLSSILPANLIRRVVPEYPALARQAGIGGTVRLQAIIGRDGAIQQLAFVSGPALLVKAAMDAVRQWLYRPTILNGEPVEVITTIEVNFVLGPR